MNLYTTSIALHVVVAIVGVGLLGAIPITASMARRAPGGVEVHAPLLERLFTYTRASFIVMMLTGILLDFAARGAFHTSYWFRGGFLLLIFVAISHARARAALRAGLTKGGDAEKIFARVERWGWIMCGAVALIGFLMEVKPF